VIIGWRRAAVVTVAFAGAVAGCAGNSRQTAPRSTATALVPVANEVQQHVAKVWPQAGRIWPGVVLKDRRIILGDGRSARLITVDGVSTLDARTLASKKVALPANGSLYTTWDGHPAVAINAADPSYVQAARAGGVSLSQVLFGAATDELFHSWQQRGNAYHDHRLRGTEYPLAVTPRLYRAMVFNDVLAAYRDPHQRTQRLGAAAYWYGRWAKEFPGEAERAVFTDVYEGVAGYFDTVASAMADGADRDDRKDIRAHVAFTPIDEAPDPRSLTIDGEAGPLGALSGMMLDETRKGWQREIGQGGLTPAGLLLRGVTPVAEKPSDGLRQSIQNVLAQQNSDLIPRFTPLVRAFNNDHDALLLVPLDTATGDLETGGYYTAKDVPYSLLARLSGTFQFTTGRLHADQASVLTGMVGKDQYLIVPIDTDHANSRLSDGRLDLSSGPLTGTFQVKAEKVGGRRQLVAR
jgi:hypothetical protein